MDLKLKDSLYSNSEPSPEIVIVGIDDNSIVSEKLGPYSSWNRNYFSQLIQSIEKEKPKVIAFDINFDTKADSSSSSFQKTIASSRSKIIIPGSQNSTNGSIIIPLDLYQENSQKSLLNRQTDADGTIRRIPLKTTGIKSFGLLIAEEYTEKALLQTLPTDQNGQMLVNFYGPPYSYKIISFVDALDGNFSPGSFSNKIVLIGLTTPSEITDEEITPTSSSIPMPGVEVWANAIQTIIDEDFLLPQSQTSQAITIAIIVLALTLLSIRLPLLAASVLTAAAFPLYYLFAKFMFSQGVIMNLLHPYFAIVISFLAAISYKYLLADKKGQELKTAFKKYVNDEIVEQIAQNPTAVKLGGENKVITTFFSDIENSTKLSEKIPTEQWVAQLNEYFTIMEGILKESGGTLDKFEGDAMMGFWNAPISQENHAFRACLAALKMQQELVKLREKWQKEGRPAFNVRIGINSGEAIVGNFGSSNQLNYTVMGDSVNTASRLESAANKAYGTYICLANFQNYLGQDSQKLVLRELDEVLLPGKNAPTKIYQLLGVIEQVDAQTLNNIKEYTFGLAAYRAKNWPEAIKHFSATVNDKPAEILLQRCQKLQKGENIAELNIQTMIFSIKEK